MTATLTDPPVPRPTDSPRPGAPPESQPLVLNAEDLERDLAWLAAVLDLRFKLYFGDPEDPDYPQQGVFEVQPPDLSHSTSPYARLVAHYGFGFAERVTLLMALVPHLRPQLFDIFCIKNQVFNQRYSEFGGIPQGDAGCFHATGETVVFVLAGNHLADRFTVQSLFDACHVFARHGILSLDRINSKDPLLKSPLSISEEYLSLLTLGQPYRPRFGSDFPARAVTSSLEWDDLVLPVETRAQLEELTAWLLHGQTLMHDWGMAGRLRPGYRCLFYGPPGTGKTLTACLLGKLTGREVFKVDLSQVLSKYIGETERNLGRVFDQAQDKGWILFFDEADALFGKRTETRDAHDRFANQEVAFLLQRIETFDGVMILASNLRENMDEAFSRRFEAMIRFPFPGPEERLSLWKKGLPCGVELEKGLDLQALARDYELTGGAILNVIRFASLRALASGSRSLNSEDLAQGISREYAKEGRVA